MEIGLDHILAIVIGSGVLSAIIAYFVSWIIVHTAIEEERALQERKQMRLAKAEWEKTHIPDDPDVLFRRR